MLLICAKIQPENPSEVKCFLQNQLLFIYESHLTTHRPRNRRTILSQPIGFEMRPNVSAVT